MKSRQAADHFNDGLNRARMMAPFLKQFSDHAYALAQDTEHAGHKRRLLRLAESSAEFVAQITRADDFQL